MSEVVATPTQSITLTDTQQFSRLLQLHAWRIEEAMQHISRATTETMERRFEMGIGLEIVCNVASL